MKVKIEIECTPIEARQFMGLPDVTALNEALTSEMQARMKTNLNALAPDELMKSWMAFGVGAQEQFRQLMTAAAGAGFTGTKPKG